MQSRLKQLRMNFGLDRQAFADLLGCTAGEVEAWERASEIPAQAMATVTERFGVAPDWLCGADVPVWGDKLLAIHPRIASQVRGMTGPNLIRMMSATTGERIAEVIQMMRREEPDLLSLEVIACWLGLASGSTHLLLTGELDPGSPVVERAADFTGIPEQWFRLGPAN